VQDETAVLIHINAISPYIGHQQVRHELRGAFHEGYGGGFKACKIKAAGHRGWIVHTVLPCVLLGYVQVRMCVGNNVRIGRGESIQKTLKPIHPLSK
jgi:hypothetical protein